MTLIIFVLLVASEMYLSKKYNRQIHRQPEIEKPPHEDFRLELSEIFTEKGLSLKDYIENARKQKYKRPHLRLVISEES